MGARTVYRLCAVTAIIAGLIGIPAGFTGNDDLFLNAGWVWVIASIGQLTAARRMRAYRNRLNDKEN